MHLRQQLCTIFSGLEPFLISGDSESALYYDLQQYWKSHPPSESDTINLAPYLPQELRSAWMGISHPAVANSIYAFERIVHLGRRNFNLYFEPTAEEFALYQSSFEQLSELSPTVLKSPYLWLLLPYKEVRKFLMERCYLRTVPIIMELSSNSYSDKIYDFYYSFLAEIFTLMALDKRYFQLEELNCFIVEMQNPAFDMARFKAQLSSEVLTSDIWDCLYARWPKPQKNDNVLNTFFEVSEQLDYNPLTALALDKVHHVWHPKHRCPTPMNNDFNTTLMSLKKVLEDSQKMCEDQDSDGIPFYQIQNKRKNIQLHPSYLSCLMYLFMHPEYENYKTDVHSLVNNYSSIGSRTGLFMDLFSRKTTFQTNSDAQQQLHYIMTQLGHEKEYQALCYIYNMPCSLPSEDAVLLDLQFIGIKELHSVYPTPFTLLMAIKECFNQKLTMSLDSEEPLFI